MKICFTPEFDRAFKKLAKRHRSLKEDFSSLLVSLVENPAQGVELFAGVRKIRMAIGSKGKGKSHGARVITYTSTVINVSGDGVVTLLTIYDKGERDSISLEEIKDLMESWDQ